MDVNTKRYERQHNMLLGIQLFAINCAATKTMIYKGIGKKIQKAREELGLSQEELARRLGYTQAALSNYELGKRRLYLANIEHIARELNRPLYYFLEETVKTHHKYEKPRDEILERIIQLLSELPKKEREFILEFVQWRRDRLR